MTEAAMGKSYAQVNSMDTGRPTIRFVKQAFPQVEDHRP
jgi:hypothetical protein